MADIALGAARKVNGEIGASEPREASSSGDVTVQRVAAGGRRRRKAVLPAVLLALLVASLVFAGLQAKTWRDDKQADTDRRDAIATAEKVTLALSEINFKTADGDISAIVDLTTGQLRQTVLKNAKAQSAIARQFKVSSTAKVEESGVVKQDSDSALVAVAVSSQVRNSQSHTAQSHWFRVTVLVDKQSDGQWLASNVEFVQ